MMESNSKIKRTTTMKTQAFQPSETMVKDSASANGSINTRHNNTSIDLAELIAQTNFFHIPSIINLLIAIGINKISFMKTFIPRPGIFALSLLIVSLLFVTNSTAQTTSLFLQSTTANPGAGGIVRDLSLTQGSSGTVTSNGTTSGTFAETLAFTITNSSLITPISSDQFFISVNVNTTSSSNLEYRFRLQRVNSSGVVQTSTTSYSTTFTGNNTGTQTATLSFSPTQTWASTDRLRLSIEVRLTSGSTSRTITVNTGNTNSFVQYNPPSITCNAITGSPFCVTASAGATVSVPFTSTGTFTSNTYTAQLSSSGGSFASPTAIGTLVSNSSGSLSISATIPANTATGSGYRIRVISNSPAVTGSDNGTNLNINLSTISIAPSATQNINAGVNGNQLTVTENPSGTALSREWFYATVSGGPYTTTTGVTATTYTPNFAVQGTYYVVCKSTYACGIVTSSQVQVNVTATISTGTITGSPFCSIVTATGSTISVPFTSAGTFTGNTYTAQLSSSGGSFSSPTTIGTLVSDASGSLSISATIPANIATGSGYRIRVISNNPAVTGSNNGTNLTINLSTNSIAPTTAQNISVVSSGTLLTVTETPVALSREWFYGTSPGGPYNTTTGITTSTYTPVFGIQGTYYVVCKSTVACGIVTSNEVIVNVSPFLVTGSISGSPFCVTATTGSAVSVPFTSTGTFGGNTYTAQLSNAGGFFTSPINIGTLVSDLNSGTINATIPANTATGGAYRIRVISNGPASAVSDNGSNLIINLANNSIAPTAIQNISAGVNGNALTANETLPATREWFYSTVSGGPYTTTGITAVSYTPNFITQGTYYIVCVSTFSCGAVTSNEVQVNVLPTLATGSISGSPFCITPVAGTPVSVSFTSVGTFSGNTYTAQLSNASGSFASPVNIGTLVIDDNSGTISATIPANTAAGTGYRIRVISNSPPAIVTDNGSDLTINLSTNSIVPTTENINVGVNGTLLTVTENPTGTALSREWFYGTTSGGPYTTSTGVTTTTYTPNFTSQGTYYIVCVSTFACGSVTSNQSQINVSATISTGTTSGSPFCVTALTGATVSVPFTGAGTFIGNTYTAQLSNASGSFASPVNIGTFVSDLNSGSMDATIPAGTVAGSGYLIRVIANAPITTGSVSNPITITSSPTANFVASTTTGTTGSIITFTDQSTNVPTSWSWSFTGGTPAISTAQNPSVTYNTTGTFSVTLTATNSCGDGVFTRTGYITITALTMPATFNTSGSFTVPPGVTCIKVEAWGGGGAGGGVTRTTGTVNGGGGAGGAYASSFLTVAPSNSLTVTVGGQRTATATSTATANTGNPSWFGDISTVFAQGGNGGTPANDNTGAGGTGSSSLSIGNSTVSAGASGANGTTNTTGSAGGAGANGGGTGATGVTGNSDGNIGNPPGGGGSGGRRSSNGNGTQLGGTGAAGRIIVSWVDASDFHISTPSCTAGSTTVTVTSLSLTNGNYTVIYNTTNPATTGNTATMNFNSGSGSFSTIVFTGPASDITVTGITFTGWGCSSTLSTNNTATIHVLPSASISYAGAPFCISDAAVKNVTQTGQGGGTYSSTPGLSIDGTTGAITPSASTAGTYIITYNFNDGFCSNTTTTSVTIGTSPVATFGYSNSFYCQALPTNPNPAVNPSPVYSGGGIAGSFTASPVGLVFVNANTGQVNLATSTPGIYTVTNKVISNGCIVTFDAPIIITALPTATISYAASTFCTTSLPQTVNRTAPSAVFGSYTASPAGLTINGANDCCDPDAGKITPSTSTPGSYLVTYTFSDGACSNTVTTAVIISAPVDLTVAAASSQVCTGSGTNITVAGSLANTTYQLRNNADNSLIGDPVTGTGGTINLPTGVLINPSTTFNVLATVIATGCTGQMSATPTVTIVAPPTATAGGSQTICSNGSAIVSGASSTNGTILWTHNGAGTLTNATTLTPAYTAAIGDGGNTVTLTMTVSNGVCPAATATYTLFVTAAPTVNLSTGSVCIGSTSTILSPVSGGVWVSNNPTVATVTNDGTVKALTAGNVTFTFTAGDCSNTTGTLTVDGSCQVVTLSQPTQLTATISGDAAICSGQPTNITVVISGGTAPYKVIYNSTEYTGTGSTITFPVSPSTNTTYNSSNVTVTGTHGCTSLTTGSATVTVTPSATIVLQDGPSSQPVCSGNPIITVDYTVGGSATGASITSGGLPNGVNGSFNAGLFTISGIPTEAGTFNYTITATGPCANSIAGSITVNASPTVSFSGLGVSYCINASPITLTGNHAPSGIFIGDGITDNGNGTATFNPSVAGEGTHTNITYIYTNANGCSNSQAQTVTVNALPVVTCPGNSTVCSNAGLITLTGGNPGGGTYSGTGVSGDTFNPDAAGAGDHTIIYSYTDPNGCSNSCTFTITVVQLVVNIDTATEKYCGAYQPAAITATATGGIPFDEPLYFYQWQVYSNELNTFINISTVSEPSAETSTYQPPMLTVPGTYVYRVDVFDQCGDVYSSTKTIIINAIPVITDVAKTSYHGADLSCPGSSDGEITITANGAAPLQYSIDNGFSYQSSNVFSGLAENTYQVVVKDNNGCTSASSGVTLIAPLPITVGASFKTDVTCHGGNNGIIFLGTVDGGTPAYVYSWTKTGDATFSVTGTTANLSGLTAGTYNYSVTDANNCTAATGSVTISQPEISTIQTNVQCHGGNTGSATVTLTGGAQPYVYVWDDAAVQTTATANNLAAGTYHVTVTDANQCVTTTQVTITEPEALSTSISSQTNVNCNGNNSGSATVSASGGTAPYSYLWDDGAAQITATANNLAAGTYHVTVTDAHGCMDIAQVTITQAGILILAPSSETDVSCFNGTNGSVTAGALTNAVGTVTYSWQDASNTIVGTTSTVGGLPIGTYTVTVTDNCFVRTNSVTIGYADHAAPVINNCPESGYTVNTDAGQCNYTAKNSEFDAQATDDCPLVYSYSLSGATSGNGNNSVNGIVFGKGTTLVTWTVSDGLHTSTCAFNVVVNDHEAPVITCPVNLTINCNASNDPGVNVSIGIATAMDNCTSTENILVTSSDVSTQNPDASNAAYYNYTITRTWKATDAAGNFSNCIQIITVHDITPPSNIVVPADVTVSCAGDVPPANDGAISVSDDCSQSITITHEDVITEQTCVNRYKISRTYTATDVSGNSSSGTQVITVNDNLAPVITTESGILNKMLECNDAAGLTAALEAAPVATDNCTASPSIHLLTDVTTPDVNCANAYVRVRTWNFTDACGNTSDNFVQTITIIDDIAPIITTAAGSLNATLECNDETGIAAAIAAAPVATDNCTASPTMNVVGDVTTPDPNCANAYVRVRTWNFTDGCGNTSSNFVQTITVQDHTAPVISTCPPSVSFCKSANDIYTIQSLVASDNCSVVTVSYNITGATSRNGTGNDASGLFAVGVSTIEWTVKDACNNTSTCSTTITVYPTPTVNVPANQSACNNTASTTVTFTGAVSGTVYNWTNDNTSIGLVAGGTGNITSFIATNTGTTPKVATITVTPVANGCTGLSQTFTITVNPTPATPVVVVADHCGSSNLSTTAGGNLLWSTGETTSSINVNSAGTYTVTSTVNGCISAAGSGVATPATPPPAPVVMVINNCDGTSTLSTTATGNLLWSTGATGSTITVNAGGTYSVTQAGTCGNSLPGFGTAAPNTTPNAPSVNVTQPNCSTPGGKITVMGPTGTGFTYSINGIDYQASTIFTGLAANDYNVTVKNAAGCISSISIATINSQPSVPGTPTVAVVNNCDGTSTLSTTATGSLLWSTGATSSSITVNTGGTFSVTQTVSGCTSLPGFGTSAPNTTPAATTVTMVQPSCSVATGTITIITPTGAGLTYSVNGNDYQVSTTFGGLVANSYNVTVKNAGGCISSPTIAIINEQPSIPPTPTVTVVNNCDGTSILSTTASGNLLWSTSATGSSITVNSGGTFSVTQTVNGCTSLPGFGTAAPNTTPAAPTVTTIQPNCSTATGTINVMSPTGAGLTYSVDGTNYQTGTSFSGLTANNYNVTVKNAGECISNQTHVTINPQPATPVAPAAGTIVQPNCTTSTGNVTLSGLPAGNWTINPGNITGNTSSALAGGLTPGNYSFIVTNAAGCTSLGSANVQINTQPVTPTAPAVGTIIQPTSITPTGTVTLNGLPSGNWTINPGNITGNTSSTSIGGLAPGTYNFTVTNAAGCTSSGSADVVINQPTSAAPPAPIVGTIIQPTCTVATGSVTLSGLPVGNWTINPGNITGNTSSTSIGGLAAGTYNFTVTNASGTSLPSANVVINPQPTIPTVAAITGTATVCAGSTTQLADVTTGGTWSVTNGTGTASISTGGLVTGITAGTITVTYSVTNSCGTGTATRPVTINVLPTASISYAGTSPVNQLVALALNEGAGITAADISGHSHNGTLTNAPTWTAGKYGQAVSLNGTNNYINIADHADFTLNPTQSYTWSSWVRNTNFNQWQTVWSQTIDANNYFYFYAHSSTDADAGPVTNGVSVFWMNGANKLVIHSNNNVLTAGVWSNVTVTYNGSLAQASRFTIYVNGVDVTNRTDVASAGTISALDPTNIRIGSNQPYGEYLNGAVDEVRFYNRLLTATELQTDMNTPIAPATGGSFCQSGTATVTQTGQAGGTYSSTAGLNINAATGAINLAASTPGNYTVSYNFTNGTCPNTATTAISIAGLPTSISYAGSPFCQTGTVAVTLTGQAGGTWSSTAGLSINSTTGAINLAASTVGTYTVTYSFGSGSCTGTATTSVTIIATPATSISYAGGPFCQNGTASVTLTGQTGGSYSSTVGLSINVSTGAINLAASTVGTYTVTYSFSNGNCSGTATTSVTINALPTASISYTGSPYCQTGTATVTLTGQAGGTYSSTVGLIINAATGAINLATSTAGTYTVTYTFGSGSCAGATTTASITIVALPTASISYTGGPFCQSGTAAVTHIGQAGGGYSSTTGLNINATTGAINLAASTAGTYTVTYSFTNGTCPGTTTTSVTIAALPTANISYAGPNTTNQLVALAMNEGAGITAADISGHSHNGTLTNAPAWTAGKYGQAVSLNGTNNYINIADHADFTLNPAQSYTWSSWVRNTNFNQWQTVWSQTIDANNYFYFYAHSSTDADAGPVTNGVSVFWMNGANKLVIHSNNNVLTAGVWSNVTVTYNGSLAQASRFTIYVNGVDVTNRTDVASAGTIAALNPTNIRVGSNQPYGEYLNGAVDEVRFYNRLLTATEVQTDMNTPIAPATGGSFCQSGTATVTQTGQAGGTYSSTAGLNINAATGAINLAASTPGTYTVTYSFTNGTCPNTATTSVSVVNCTLATKVQTQVVNPKAPQLSVKMEVTVYPNPTLSFFNLKVKSQSNETVEIRVFDMLGKVVQQQRGAPEQTFRLGDRMAAGIYVVEVRQAGQVMTTKVIKKGDQILINN
jgi:hypothetical protein